MKVATESVLVVTNDKNIVVAIVRKDTGLQKNLIYRVNDAALSDIESLLGGTTDVSPLVDEDK